MFLGCSVCFFDATVLAWLWITLGLCLPLDLQQDSVHEPCTCYGLGVLGYFIYENYLMISTCQPNDITILKGELEGGREENILWVMFLGSLEGSLVWTYQTQLL